MSIQRSIRALLNPLILGLGLCSTSVRQWNHSWRRSKNRNFEFIALTIVSLIVLGLILKGTQNTTRSFFQPAVETDEDLYLMDEGQFNETNTVYEVSEPLKEIFNDVLQQIQKYSPEGNLDTTKGPDCDIENVSVTDTAKFYKLSESSLKKCVQIPDDIFSKVQGKQRAFVSEVKNNLLSKFKEISPAAFKDEGIVFVGGGKSSLFALPAIEAIRANSGVKMRNTVPIEIIIPPQYDDDRAFCQNVLPKIDPHGLSRCIFLSDVFGKEYLSGIEGEKLKALALLVSSFEKVLLLEADNYVINPLDNYFSDNSFRDKGLVLWPDYWRRLHHPRLYDIFDVSIDRSNIVRNSFDDVSPRYVFKRETNDNTPFHDFDHTIPDGSTETGQILVDKKKHLDTIIFNLYLNFNGDSYFYPLLIQDPALNGGKDTLAFAAHVLHGQELYYQVKTPVGNLGHWIDRKTGLRVPDDEIETTEDKEFRQTAIVQHDYIQDWKYHELANEIITGHVDEEELKLCAKWCNDHNKTFSEPDDGKMLDECRSLSKVKDDVESTVRDLYRLSDTAALYMYTPATFIHSHLSQYDPWEWYQKSISVSDHSKAKNKLWGSSKTNHYRIYDSKITFLTEYDLELKNWSIFQEFLCDDLESYKNFSYLAEQLKSTADTSKSLKAMCAYIKTRVKYLKQNAL